MDSDSSNESENAASESEDNNDINGTNSEVKNEKDVEVQKDITWKDLVSNTK